MIIYGIKYELDKTLNDVQKLIELLDTVEVIRFNRFKNKNSAIQFLLGRVLLRYMLNKHYKLVNRDININYTKYGKPFLNDVSIHFNIAHSAQWVVCVVADTSVGVDIEKISRFRPTVAQRQLSVDEYKDLMALDGTEQIDYFYSLWTSKESYSKAIGRGLTIPFSSFSIKKSQLNQLFITDDNYLIKQYDIDTTYKMAVCTTKNDFADNVKEITVEQLNIFV
ncbi:MAG: 4-phosphopantetheinyl transferase [Clostridiales bacterium]|nr:MAG: 4-phosphopantetheinyl transferase [Clostridiales bacterium]